MSRRKERSVFLTKRRDAINVIKNIRNTRRLLAKHPFNGETFKAINGSERGIEQLLGRDIVFSLLNESEKLKLRHDSNMTLNKEEDSAFEVLREATEKFLGGLRSRDDVLHLESKHAQNILSKNQAAVEAFNAFEMPSGALDCERAISTLEHLEIIAEETEEAIPGFEHELDKEEDEEYTEEQHEDADELPEDGPDGSDDDDDKSEDDSTDDIDLGEDDDSYEEDDDDDDGNGAPVPEEEKDTPTDLSFIADEQNFVTLAPKFILPVDVCTEGAGYTQEKGAIILSKYHEVMAKYYGAMSKLADVFADVNCTNDKLLRGKVRLYRKLDAIINLADKFEPLTNALKKTCEGLENASAVVLKKATFDPKLA